LANPFLVTGLDVGTTKVCAVTAEVGAEGPPNIVGIGVSPCVGLKKGNVVDLEATTSAIRSAVSSVERMTGEEIRSVIVGVTGEHVACLNRRNVLAVSSPGREISVEDVYRLSEMAKVIVLPPDREIIHTIPRWYSIDGQVGIRSPVGMYGNRLEVETHIVTALSSFIQNVVKCVHQAGLSSEMTVLEPIATGESILHRGERDLGVALVDIGGGTSDVAIYKDGEVLYSGVIPIGGNHVTRDIAVGLRTTDEEAERVKVRFGTVTVDGPDALGSFEVNSFGSEAPRVLPCRLLAEIIEPRMAEICQFIVEHIREAGCEDRLPGGLVFAGGGALIDGLAELAFTETGLPARVGSPAGITGLVEEVGSPVYATAVGLVLYWARYHTRPTVDDEGVRFFGKLWARFLDWFSDIRKF
jgi:cell division protein FtsA